MLLDIYARRGIKTTFFFTGYIGRLVSEAVRMAAEQGHEVGSHGKSHLPENGFDVMPFERQKEHLSYSKKLLEDIAGQEVVSFRAPALRVGDNTARALIETGYRIDSSVASQRFDFFLSFGGFKKLRWLWAPRKPYRTSVESIFRRGAGPLVEVPLSALFLPYVGTTMRIFPGITSRQRPMFHWEAKTTGKPIVFDIHPNEFIDESDEQRVVHKRSSNPVTYFLKDVLRSRLKIKNLGQRAAPLYARELDYYRSRGYEFTTIRHYCERTGLL